MKLVCNKCKGTKKFRGLGCIITICQDCNGVGLVEASKILNDEDDQPKKLKRTRKEKTDGEES